MPGLKGRGHELALAPVELPLAAEDAIANGGPEGMMNGYAFVEVVGMFDQNAVEVFGFVEQDAWEWTKAHAVDITHARNPKQQVEAIFPEVG